MLKELANKALNLVKQKDCKTEGGVCYPASDYAVVPDKTSVSTWKLRLSQGRPGNITVSQLGRAAAAFSPGGFRGQQVQLSSQEKPRAKARIRREYRKLGVATENIPASVKEQSFLVSYDKETNQYRWFAIYSNNYRDNDNPPEIISEVSHRSFVKGVETGVYPYPELWLWHVPGSRVGISDWLSFTDEGFAVASGVFDEGKEHVAKGLSEQEDLLVSHGMPKPFVKRDPNDKSVIIQHITREISPLPSMAAANKLTGFELLGKEVSMSDEHTKDGIPEHKIPFLEEVGITSDQVRQFNEMIKGNAKQAEKDDLEKKEEDTPTQETPKKEEGELTLESIAGLLEAGLKPIAERINAQETRLKELERSDEEKIVDKAANTPQASRAALLQASVEKLFSKDTQVDGRTSIAKSGPKQAPVENLENMPPFLRWMQEDGGLVEEVQ